MANVTPAAFSYTGGTLRSGRVVPARLRFTAGNVTAASETPLTTAAEIPKLDRLTRADMIPGEDEMSFMRRAAIWQKTMLAIESAFEAVNARVDEVALYARLNAVENLAAAANDNAIAAQTTAATVSAAVAETFADIDPVYSNNYTDRVEP